MSFSGRRYGLDLEKLLSLFPFQISARLRLDRGLIPVVRDAHVPAALLKLWLRSLPEPLIPDTFYLRCLAVCDQPEEACRIAELLPAVNRLVLAKLLELLQVYFYLFSF